MLTSQGFKYLGLQPTARVAAQLDMLAGAPDPDLDPEAGTNGAAEGGGR
jgi:hypothetical protein